MAIDRIGSRQATAVNPLERAGPTQKSHAGTRIEFHESFRFKEQLIEEYVTNKGQALTCDKLIACFRNLIRVIIYAHVDIVPSNLRKLGQYTLEASFSPDYQKTGYSPGILIPLPPGIPPLIATNYSSTPSLIAAIDEFLLAVTQVNDAANLLRLIIVTSHEFGHYRSYKNGNHDYQLASAMQYMMQRQVLGHSDLTWLIFREECTAWNIAQYELQKTGFIDWQIFSTVKNDSLQAYFDLLQLKHADLHALINLSLIGEDFVQCSNPAYGNNF